MDVHAREGALLGLLTKLNHATGAMAQTARAPWRLPLLLATLGTFAHALDAKLRCAHTFADAVGAESVVLMPRHELALLHASFAGEGASVAASVVAALDEDLSAEARGGQFYMGIVERCARECAATTRNQ